MTPKCLNSLLRRAHKNVRASRTAMASLGVGVGDDWAVAAAVAVPRPQRRRARACTVRVGRPRQHRRDTCRTGPEDQPRRQMA